MSHKSANTIQPVILKISSQDVREALRMGCADFNATPSHLFFLALIYPIVGIVLMRFTFGYNLLPLVFPIIAGFALIGPMVASGLYEMSRRRELGFDVSMKNALDIFKSSSIETIFALGVVQLLIYIYWLNSAQLIYLLIFGTVAQESYVGFAYQVLTTPSGWTLIVAGCGIGFLFAVLVLFISVVSFPMLVDRDVGVVIAIQTSVRAVMANPVTMAMWGLVVAFALAIGSLPLFVGLAVVMPILGHATWHLYRRVVSWPNPPNQH